jgi:hypothetical protein
MSLRKRRSKVSHRPDAMPQIISRIPWHDGMSRQELDKVISKELIAIWLSMWSEKELQLRTKIERGEADDLMPGLYSKLDEIILKQAGTLGWRLLVSTRVVLRISMWEAEKNGPELFERLGKALAISVRIVQRQELPPIDDPDLVPTQDQSIRELRTVLREMRKALSAKRTTPDGPEVVACFARIVLESGKRCPLLSANLFRWLRFLSGNPQCLTAQRSDRRLSPATLFREWLSWSKGHAPETLRKKISALRSSLTKQ